MQTAGRTVVFSAITVMISLLALLTFPFSYLRSFAYAGVAVVGLAAVAAVVVLPAVLAVLGPRIEKGRLFKRKVPADDGGGFWKHQSERVMSGWSTIARPAKRATCPVVHNTTRYVIGSHPLKSCR